MPKKQDPSFDEDFQDETEDLSEYDEEEDDSDSSEDDEEYDEEYDEDYDEDSEDGALKGGWRKKAIFATAGIIAVGLGAFYVITNYFPLAKPTQGSGKFATSNGMGHVTPSAGVPVAAIKPSAAPVAKATPVEMPAARVEKKPKVEAPELPAASEPKPKAQAAPERHRTNVRAHFRQAVDHPQRPSKKASYAKAHPLAAHSGAYAVQVGAFSQRANAEGLVDSLKKAGIPATLVASGGASAPSFSVRSTIVNSRARANQLIDNFSKAGHPSILTTAGRGKFALQLGTFSNQELAQTMVSELNHKGLYVSISASGAVQGSATKVFAGEYPSLAEARKVVADLRAKNIPAVVIHR